MIGSDNGLTVTAMIKSMKREGFSYEEIYDTLAGAGIESCDLQLLFDRIEEEFEEMEFESRKSRISREVDEVFEVKLRKLKVDFNSKFRVLNSKIESIENSLDRIEDILFELQDD